MTDTAVAPSAARASSPGRFGDYIQLLKPRVMSLVVFTALTGLVCADVRMDPALAAIAILAIAVGAGASGALNMAYDSDIDARMRRTRGRPVPMGRISRADAAGFGVVLSLFACMTMFLAVNAIAAGLLAFTIVFYAAVYTLWLKRSTPQNIVIGGAAGALPPVVGWAAASGTAPANAWLLFAIIFLWTPPHFWALALNTGGDYETAGVPMLPVVKGAKATRRQILIYSVLLAVVGVLPAFTGLGGRLYAVTATAFGALFVALAARLYRSRAGEAPQPGPDGLYAVKPGAREARDVFAASLLYLSAVFASLLVEHGLGLYR